MRSILLLIHSASHPIYQNNIVALVNGYKAMIDRYKLNVTVVTFGGTSSDPNMERVENVILDTDEKQVADALFAAIDRGSNSTYDVIVKTNTNTVVNLPLLCEFCSSNMFEEGVVYSSLCMLATNDAGENTPFPSGMFVMADRDTWKTIVEKYPEAMEYTDNNFTMNASVKHQDVESENQLVWIGYSDEFLIGVCIKLAGGIHIQSLPCSSISQSKQVIFQSLIEWGALHNDIGTQYLAVNCKLDLYTPGVGGDLFFGSYEEKFRTLYEHLIITALCRMFEHNTPSYQDVMYVANHKLYHC